MARNLQLARRETFFNDPFFADIMSLQDNDLHKKLDVFKQKSLLGVGKGEAKKCPVRSHRLSCRHQGASKGCNSAQPEKDLFTNLSVSCEVVSDHGKSVVGAVAAK